MCRVQYDPCDRARQQKGHEAEPDEKACDPKELIAVFGTPEAAKKHLTESSALRCRNCHSA